MKKLTLILIALIYSNIVFADDNIAQNKTLIINNQNDVNMTVYYSACYTSDSFWWGHNTEYCNEDSFATLYAKNNPKGPRFKEITWPKTSGSKLEYLKITKIMASNFEGTQTAYANTTRTFYAYAQNGAITQDGINSTHQALLLTLKSLDGTITDRYGAF